MKLKDRLFDFWVLGIWWPIFLARYYRLKNWFLKKIGHELVIALYPNPLLKWPVNRPCFCGSGKKVKMCCLSKIARNIDLKDYIFISKRLREAGVKL